ncbi:MAG: hypothetical protein U0794_10070 [Isosphaeraceae bacterium]
MPFPSYDELSAALTARYGRLATRLEAADAFESLVAALLDRALDGPRRHRAIEALRESGLLDAQALAEADPTEIGEALRGAGLKIQDKALGPLRRVARWLVEIHHGDADALADPEILGLNRTAPRRARRTQRSRSGDGRHLAPRRAQPANLSGRPGVVSRLRAAWLARHDG